MYGGLLKYTEFFFRLRRADRAHRQRTREQRHARREKSHRGVVCARLACAERALPRVSVKSERQHRNGVKQVVLNTGVPRGGTPCGHNSDLRESTQTIN